MSSKVIETVASFAFFRDVAIDNSIASMLMIELSTMTSEKISKTKRATTVNRTRA